MLDLPGQEEMFLAIRMEPVQREEVERKASKVKGPVQ